MRNDFNSYRTIIAKRADVATCTHQVKVNDRIGWNRFTKATKCAECWRVWEQENAEATAMESGYCGY